MKLYFNINFKTKFGEKLQLLVFEEGKENKVHDLSYTDNGNWTVEVDYFSKSITYQYQLIGKDGNIVDKEIPFHQLNFPHNYEEFIVFDYWNLKNYPENYLDNKILKNYWRNFKPEKVTPLKKHTHLFRIEAPVYHPNWRVVMLGNCAALGNWEYLKTVPMFQTGLGIWEVAVELPDNQMIQYKYGLMNNNSGEIIDLEFGDNRWALPNGEKNILQIKADHYFKFKAYELYHAAGVAIPVFSLRSENSFGVGEFRDLKLLADWAVKTQLSILQVLPINDTTANYSWTDSYPYSAISVYALHPQYLSIDALEYALPNALKKEFLEKKEILNSEKFVSYEEMISAKWYFIKAVFQQHKKEIVKEANFKKFIKRNESWLLPYCAFCVLRDKYKTPDFEKWKTHKKFISGKIAVFFNPKNKDFETAMNHAWVQYQLHLQLTDAVEYLHLSGISIKGDLPIGIYRHSVEAWTEPELFGMDFQAGAPPDQFTEDGQNWGFPTYNWDAMKKEDFRWWKNRFSALEQYFDAMRIDHILGFFRIWQMPMSSTEGILGYFHPAVPVKIEEFYARNIPFNYDRYCKPFINDDVLWNYFGEERDAIRNKFLVDLPNGNYELKLEFNTQRKLTNYFATHPNSWPEKKLISLCANVLFLEEENPDGEKVYHPRFFVYKTDSFIYLPEDEKQAIYHLYNDYFFNRQNALWYQSAMEKLPEILDATEMLICGEDLGFVPDCVPEVMNRLAVAALKVQRMPYENVEWYDPKTATYLNVVTTSTHDSSTLRQWWHEDREMTQKYFYQQLRQCGTAPWDLEPELAEMILLQHLNSNAMLAIFPLQDFLATDENLLNPDLNLERINNPAVFPNYWRYRMHLNLEQLLNEKDFNEKIAQWVINSNRI